MDKTKTIIFSLGGSLVSNHRGINIDFLKKFRKVILNKTKKGFRFVVVVGGGIVCREYQQAARKINKVNNDDLDWIGIKATKLNAELIRTMFSGLAYKEVINNPNLKVKTNKSIIIGAGFVPGSSSDKDAVILAKNFGARLVVNLSNIDYLRDRDPRKYKNTKIIKFISWKDFKRIVGKDWDPGKNAPFDPVASRLAEKNGIQVVILNGEKIDNLKNFLESKNFKGTIIG